MVCRLCVIPSNLLSHSVSCCFGVVPKPLQQRSHLGHVMLSGHFNGISFLIPMLSQIHLPPRGNPPLDHLKMSKMSSPPEWSAPIIGRLIEGRDPTILEQQSDTGGSSKATSDQEGSGSENGLLIDTNIRAGQQHGDNLVMAIVTSLVKGCEATGSFFPIDIDPLVLLEDPTRLFLVSVSGRDPKSLFHMITPRKERKEMKRKEKKKKLNSD